MSLLQLRSRSGALFFLLIAALCLPVEGQSANFSGTWVRDDSDSEDPIATLEEEIEYGPGGSPSGVTFRGFGGGGRGRSRGRGARGPDQDELAKSRERLVHLTEGLEALRIVHRNPDLEIRDTNRETRQLFTDGRVTGDGFGSQTSTSIQDGVLVIETRTGQGQLLQYLELDPDGRRMYLLTDVQGAGREAVRFRTVFDRARGPSCADRPLRGGGLPRRRSCPSPSRPFSCRRSLTARSGAQR